MKDVKDKLDELGRTWEEYKKTNDAKIELLEKKGLSASEQKEKLDKMDAAMDALDKKIADLNAAIARTGGQGGDIVDADVKEYQDFASKHIGRRITIQEAKDLQERGKQFREFMREGKHSRGNGELQLKTLSVDSEVGGGFFVIPEVSAEIIKKVNESSPIRQLASVVSISTASFKVNSDLSARAASWQGERSSRSEGTSPTVNQDEIFVHEMDCNPGATQQFLDDAAVNVEAWLSEYAAEAFALAEATAFVSGSGVGRPSGILSYADGTVYGKVERIATDATGAISGDSLINVQEALKEPYQRAASWLMHRTTRGTIRKIKDGTNYLWQPGLQAGAPSTLLEKPVYLAADLNTSLAATTDGIMIYGDFKQGYQIVDRIGIRVLRDPYSSKPKVIFFTTKRVGGGVKNYEALKILQVHS